MPTNHYNQTTRIVGIFAIALLLLSGCKRSSTNSALTDKELVSDTSQPVRLSSEDGDAAEPAIAAAPDGSAYVAWVTHVSQTQADLMIARVTGDGQLQDSAVRVNPEPGMATAWRGDPPTIAVGRDHTVFVGWTARVDTESGHATDIYLSSSRDRGKTFGTPVKINDDTKPGDHGMHSLAIGKDGHIFMAWLDERNINQPESLKPNMPAGHHMESNREVFVSSSTDGGRSFSVNKRVASDVCPCCKTSLAVGKDGRVYLSWRQVLPGDYRHIALASSVDGGNTFSKAAIVSDDQWMLKGCPVTGAALLTEQNGNLRVLWYAAGAKGEHGIYWSESKDGGQSFSPRALLAATSARGTPAVTADVNGADQASWGVWEGNENGKTLVRAARLGDNESASKTAIVADPGELPAAVAAADQVFIAYVVKRGELRSIWLANLPKNREAL